MFLPFYSPHGNAETIHRILFYVSKATPSTKSTNFGSRYLLQGFSELDKV